MNNGNVPLGIVVTAVDRASETLSRVAANTKRLAATFDTLKGRIKNAFQYHVIDRGLLIMERGITAVARAIPDLIRKGEQWAETVDSVADATGLSARKASELAAIQSVVGGSTEALSRGIVILARNASTNREAFDKLGIATRDSNGRMLDAYTIFQNARRRISETGASLLSTAAAQRAFGRGGAELLDLLTLSNAQWRIYSEEARRSGLILTEAGAKAAEQWARTQRLLGQTITGLGAQILQGAAPALISLANGVTQAIQRNMDNIVRFVVQAVNFVGGLIGGFLGFDMGAASVAERVDDAGDKAQRAGGKVRGLTEASLANERASKKAAAGQDAYSKSLQRSIDRIDRQLEALDRSERKADSRRTQQQLLADIAQARAELADIRSDSIFAAGMSEAEAELARQAQSARIVDGQKRVADAERRLRDERRGQERQDQRDRLTDQRDQLQRMLTAHQRAMSRISASSASLGRGLGASFRAGTKPISDLAEKGIPKLSEGLQQAAKEAQAAGKQIAEAIKSALFGEPTLAMKGGVVVTVRQGGLIDGIKKLVDGISSLSSWIGGSSGLITTIGGLVTAIGAWKLLNLPGGTPGGTPPATPGGSGKAPTSWLGNLIRGIGTGASLTFATDRLRQDMSGTQLIEQLARQHGLTSEEVARLTRANWNGGGVEAVQREMQAILKARANKGARAGRRSNTLGGGFGGFDPLGMLMGTGSTWGVLGRSGGVGPGSPGVQSLPGFGMTLRPLEGVFRRFWGSDSPIGRGQREATDASATGATYQAETAGNTQPLGAGQMGVNVNQWGAGNLTTKVGDWAAGPLGVSNNNFLAIGTIEKANIKIPIKASKGDLPESVVTLKGVKLDTSLMERWLKQIYQKQTYNGWTAASAGMQTQKDTGFIKKYTDLTQARIGSGNVNTRLSQMHETLKDIKKQGGGGSGGGRAAGGYIPPGWSGTVGETGREHIQMYPGGGAMVTSNANLPNVARASGGGGSVTVVNHITIDRSAMRQMLAGKSATTSLKPVS
ncbi:MAG: hypothetical protein KF809_17315 [Chloroflexi bacterium]|nr:hypothetical protein [Chloroflexota bacterium]